MDVVNTYPINIAGTLFNPSVLEFGLQDVSAPDAGRTLTGRMIPAKICTKVTIKVEFWEPSRQLVSDVLHCFYQKKTNGKLKLVNGQPIPLNSFSVAYYDPITGDKVVREMYVGDRSIPVRMWGTQRAWYSKLSFTLIEI